MAVLTTSGTSQETCFFCEGRARTGCRGFGVQGRCSVVTPGERGPPSTAAGGDATAGWGGQGTATVPL